MSQCVLLPNFNTGDILKVFGHIGTSLVLYLCSLLLISSVHVVVCLFLDIHEQV